eukprot:91642-Chlamydomonas_euryale.AAC.2
MVQDGRGEVRHGMQPKSEQRSRQGRVQGRAGQGSVMGRARQCLRPGRAGSTAGSGKAGNIGLIRAKQGKTGCVRRPAIHVGLSRASGRAASVAAAAAPAHGAPACLPAAIRARGLSRCRRLPWHPTALGTSAGMRRTAPAAASSPAGCCPGWPPSRPARR